MKLKGKIKFDKSKLVDNKITTLKKVQLFDDKKKKSKFGKPFDMLVNLTLDLGRRSGLVSGFRFEQAKGTSVDFPTTAFQIVGFDVRSVPEPTTLLLLGTGVVYVSAGFVR